MEESMVDYPEAKAYFVNESRVFIDALSTPESRYAIVIHKTACGAPCTAEEQGVFFQTNVEEKSVHYVIGKDGTVVQCVLEKDGAGGNCCLENGYDHFWDSAPVKSNFNLCTYSIEHCDYSNDNSDVLTDAQKLASFKLVAYLCHKYNIGIDHIKGHNTLDPISRARCPGNYPWNELFAYLKGEGVMVPAGWNDNGSVLTCPNGNVATLGFRQYILDNEWDAGDYLLENAEGLANVEESNTTLGSGTRQITRLHSLEWTNDRGVFVGWIGQELLYVKKDRDNCRTIISQLQSQISILKQGVPSADVSACVATCEKLLADLKAFQS